MPRPPIDPLDQAGSESARRLVDAVMDGAKPQSVSEIVQRLTELTPDDPQDALMIAGITKALDQIPKETPK